MPRLNHLILGIAAILAVIFVVLQRHTEDSKKPATPELSEAEAQSDYYVVNARLQQTDDQGRLQYDVTAPHMTHRQNQDIWLLQAPKMTLFVELGEPWYGEAEHGRIWNDGDEAELLGEVKFWRLASPVNRPMTIDTQNVYLQPNLKYARTAAKVVVQQEQNWLTGIGGQIFLDEERYELFSAVRGYYVPQSD